MNPARSVLYCSLAREWLTRGGKELVAKLFGGLNFSPQKPPRSHYSCPNPASPRQRHRAGGHKKPQTATGSGDGKRPSDFPDEPDEGCRHGFDIPVSF